MKNATSYVNISVCKSNIKTKKSTYYTKVRKSGKLSSDALLQKVKMSVPYIDVEMVKIAVEKMAEIMLEEAKKGTIIDFLD